MKKFAVFSGFLGSGKTTTMMALTAFRQENAGPIAMISNDLGHGVNLADHRLAQLNGCRADEMTEDCICYRNEDLADRLNAFYAEGCELVISDIPGFGVGALEHVYHGLTEKFPGSFELAPFTVLTEPATVALLRAGEGGDLTYIYETQLAEADLIVLNKCDLLDEEERQTAMRWLREQQPQAKVLAVSARTGEGIPELAEALRQGKASMRRPEIGYGGADFQKAMGKISEYYLQARATVCCDTFDGTAWLTELAKQVQETVRQDGCDVPHLKLLAWEPEGDYGKVDLLGIGRPPVVTRPFERPCTDVALILNASAVCPSARLQARMAEILDRVSKAYQLELQLFKTECFGMLD